MSNKVLLIATGDTIAQRPGVSQVATGKDLLTHVGPVAAEVVVEDMLAEPSWDTSVTTMLAIARRAHAALTEHGFDGVVVTHGVDNLEEAAYLTDLLVGPAAALGGIVFTGATRYLDDLSSDGPRNLSSALAVAADPAVRGAGVLVCFDDELHAARWARLADPTRPAAFTSAPYPRLGAVVDGKAALVASPPPLHQRPPSEPESDVAVIRAYSGMTAAMVNAVVDAGARGVVIEGSGAGNVPIELFATIMELTHWEIPVVIVPRVPVIGRGTTGAELAEKAGAILAPGMTAGHARVALMVALGHGGVRAAREMFRR
jgi:L-asparaginase